LVVDRIGIALRAAAFWLIKPERRHDRRSEEFLGTGPAARIAGAGGAAISRIGPAENVEVTPEAVRGEERDVRVSRTPSLGLPSKDCQEGFGNPGTFRQPRRGWMALQSRRRWGRHRLRPSVEKNEPTAESLQRLVEP